MLILGPPPKSLSERVEIMSSKKFARLITSIQQYDRVAVAYSGGVDSTLLLYAAKTALGPGKVVAFTILSSLSPSYAVEKWRSVFLEHFSGEVEHKEINTDPLAWQEFVENGSKRCYFCKKHMYSLLKDSMKGEDCYILFDGTNTDDMKEDRPGLKAIRELDIKTPLFDVDLSKDEIRKIAKEIGLSNYDLPSNSCLATRIPTTRIIDKKILKRINRAETFLLEIGFSGCRVRPIGSYAIIEVQAADVDKISQLLIRNKITSYFNSLSFYDVALSFTQR